MNTLTSSRRDVMRALAILPAMIAMPAAASAPTGLICTPLATTPQWQSAVKAMEAASDAYDAYYKAIYEPIWNARRQPLSDEEAELQRRIDAVPHYSTERTYLSEDGTPARMTTRNNAEVRAALGFVDDIESENDDYRECARELLSLFGKRCAQEHEIKKGFVFSELADMPADIEVEHDRLEKAGAETWRAVAEFEAATPGDLIAKVAFLKTQDDNLDPDEMLADLRRVFGEA